MSEAGSETGGSGDPKMRPTKRLQITPNGVSRDHKRFMSDAPDLLTAAGTTTLGVCADRDQKSHSATPPKATHRFVPFERSICNKVGCNTPLLHRGVAAFTMQALLHPIQQCEECAYPQLSSVMSNFTVLASQSAHMAPDDATIVKELVAREEAW